MKIGEILIVDKIPKQKGFFILHLNIGYKKIIAVCQLNKNQDLKKIVGKKVCVLVNIKPRKIKGHISEGLILLVRNKIGEIIFIEPDSQDVEVGLKIH